jgi:hypothetical protein
MNRFSWLRMAGLLLVIALLATSFGVALAAPATDTDPPETTVRFRGEVVRLSDPDFVVRTPVGRYVTVHTTGGTEWRGLRGFGDLRIGMPVGVEGVLTGNGTVNAQVVARLGDRIAGLVTATGDHSLTVRTLRGEILTVLWTEETRCVIGDAGDGAAGDDAVDSACSRIQVGDHIAAGGHRDGNTFHARWIAARVPPDDSPAESPEKSPAPAVVSEETK